MGDEPLTDLPQPLPTVQEPGNASAQADVRAVTDLLAAVTRLAVRRRETLSAAEMLLAELEAAKADQA